MAVADDQAASAPALPAAMIHPTREEFRVLARTHSVVPVWTELLADFITPVAAFARLTRSGEPGFVLESVEHGERWSRWSFVGRRPAATMVARGRQVTVSLGDVDHDTAATVGAALDEVPLDAGILAAVESLLERFRSPDHDRLPPLHGGLVGYLGYDVVREVEHLPDIPADDQDLPDAVQYVIGELAAFDHWRQQVTLLANAFVPPGLSDEELDARYDAAAERLARLASDGASPLDEPLVAPPDPSEPLPEVTSNLPRGAYEAAVAASTNP